MAATGREGREREMTIFCTGEYFHQNKTTELQVPCFFACQAYLFYSFTTGPTHPLAHNVYLHCSTSLSQPLSFPWVHSTVNRSSLLCFGHSTQMPPNEARCRCSYWGSWPALLGHNIFYPPSVNRVIKSTLIHSKSRSWIFFITGGYMPV